MKTQTLNTTFTGNAGPMMGEVNRLSGAIQTAMGGIFSRAQAIQNASRAYGMSASGVQAAARLGDASGVKGLADAVAQLANYRQMGADMGRRGAGRMGLNLKAYDTADEAGQFDMLAEGLAKIKDRRSRWRAAARLGVGTEALLERAGQFELHPEQARSTGERAERGAASAETLAVQEELGIFKRSLWDQYTSGIGQAFGSVISTGEYLGAKRQGRLTPGLRKEWAETNELMLYMFPVGTTVALLRKIADHLYGIHENTK